MSFLAVFWSNHLACGTSKPSISNGVAVLREFKTFIIEQNPAAKHWKLSSAIHTQAQDIHILSTGYIAL
jgi:hypothetical protein